MSDFKAKMHQIRFLLGLCLMTPLETLQHCLRPYGGGIISRMIIMKNFSLIHEDAQRKDDWRLRINWATG